MVTKMRLARNDGRHPFSIFLITALPTLLSSPSFILTSAATTGYTFPNETEPNSTVLEDSLASTYLLFQVPKFSCLFSFNSSYGNYHEAEAETLLLSIGPDLDYITSSYLDSTINRAFATIEGGADGLSLHGVDLDVVTKSLFTDSSRRIFLRRGLGDASSQPLVQAEITGEASFTPPSNSSGLTLTQDMVRNLISSSFSTSTEVGLYLTLLQQNTLGNEILKSIAGITVYTNVDDADETAANTAESKGVSAGDIEPKIYLTATNGGTDKESNAIQTGGVFAIVCALAIAVTGLLVYGNKKKHSRGNVEFDTMTGTHQKRSRSGRKRFGNGDDIERIDTVEADDSFDVEDPDLNGTVNGGQWLDSYSQKDQEQAEQSTHSHHQSKSSRSFQTSEKKSKNKRGSVCNANIIPMMSIAETEEERDHNLSHTHPSFFPTLMKRIRSYWTERKAANDGRRHDHEIVFEKNSKVVFRDFPRHDGSPCLMYTANDERNEYTTRQEWGSHDKQTHVDGDCMGTPTLNNAPSRSESHNELEGDDDHSHKSDSTSSSNVPANIDSFVDTLEKLITAKSRQYQERVKMDRERAERRKAHEKKRRKGRDESQTMNDYSNDTVRVNGQEKDAAPLNANVANSNRSRSPPASKSFDSKTDSPPFKVVSPDHSSALTERKNDHSLPSDIIFDI